MVCCKPGTHFGGTNLDFSMNQYLYEWKSDGISIINLSVISLSVVAGSNKCFCPGLKNLIDLPGP